MSKFKVGDRVRVIKPHPGTYWEIGMDGVIERLREGTLKYHVIADDGKSQTLAEEQLELAKEAAKRPFKVGDKVRIVKQRTTGCGNSLVPETLDSTVYTITRDDHSDLPYRCFDQSTKKRYWCTAEQLELVEEPRLILDILQ